MTTLPHGFRQYSQLEIALIEIIEAHDKKNDYKQ